MGIRYFLNPSVGHRTQILYNDRSKVNGIVKVLTTCFPGELCGLNYDEGIKSPAYDLLADMQKHVPTKL
jgi:hypothetical protein